MASGWYSISIPGNPDAIDTTSGVAYGGIYDEVIDMPMNIETDIISFTVPAGRYLNYFGASASAKTDMTFRFYIDGQLKEVRRNAWTERNVEFHIGGTVGAGKIIKITGEHRALNGLPHNADATILGILYIS